MSDTTLVIMAAGMGSRFGGIKQLEPVGPNGEIIMDYSIYGALKAGFTKVVFIIRRDLEKDFKEIIGRRMESMVKVEYVFQELDNIPDQYEVPEGRTKPWGTGQAVLCCKEVVKEPFLVINADDYYGKEAFQKINEFLNNKNYSENQYCMAGFILGNTLSENGSVTRGVCKAENGLLKDITETSGIVSEEDKVFAVNPLGEKTLIDRSSVVSMNMWGFKPEIFKELEQGFTEFLSGLKENDIKKEYLLPEVVGNLIKMNKADVHVLETQDKWFGVTYKEDKAIVIESIQKLINQGEYPAKLF